MAGSYSIEKSSDLEADNVPRRSFSAASFELSYNNTIHSYTIHVWWYSIRSMRLDDLVRVVMRRGRLDVEHLREAVELGGRRPGRAGAEVDDVLLGGTELGERKSVV